MNMNPVENSVTPLECPTRVFGTGKFANVVEEHELTDLNFHEIRDEQNRPPIARPMPAETLSWPDIH
jgi:hypothetical protein